MTFRSWNGLIEPRQFSDFVYHIRTNPGELSCPVCGKPVTAQLMSSFNMNQMGRVIFTCIGLDCEFNRMGFAVETIPAGGR